MDNAFCKTFSKNMDFIPTCAFLYCLAMYIALMFFSYLKPFPVFPGRCLFNVENHKIHKYISLPLYNSVDGVIFLFRKKSSTLSDSNKN